MGGLVYQDRHRSADCQNQVAVVDRNNVPQHEIAGNNLFAGHPRFVGYSQGVLIGVCMALHTDVTVAVEIVVHGVLHLINLVLIPFDIDAVKRHTARTAHTSP